jgi:Co/Zn/Cd efflux system component
LSGSNLSRYFTKLYSNYANTISLNKNLLLSGLAGFIVSVIIAFVFSKNSNNDFETSILTVVTGFISSKIVFVFLFHLDNKKKYTKRFTGKLDLYILKQIATKMIFADAIFDIINNVSRFFILLELLRINYPPVQAATLASIIASCFSYLAINLIIRRLNVFKFRKKLI